MLTLPIAGTWKIERRRRPDLEIFICSIDPSLLGHQSVILWLKMSDKKSVEIVSMVHSDREAHGKEGTNNQLHNHEGKNVFEV